MKTTLRGGAIGYLMLREKCEFHSVKDSEEHERKRSVLRKWCRIHKTRLRDVGADRLWTVGIGLHQRTGLVKALSCLKKRDSHTLVITKTADLELDPARECMLLLNLYYKRIVVYEAETLQPLNKTNRQLLKMRKNFDPTLLAEVGKELKTLNQQVTHMVRRTKPGRKPFGSRPGEMEIIQQMREGRRARLSFAAIADKLNQEKKLSRDGKRWDAKTVQRIYDRKSRLPK
jgi:hypothetical protein